MGISWASPVGTIAAVQLIEGTDTVMIASEGYLCTTFDSINSKLGDNSDVYERHVFDKHSVMLTGLKPDTKYSYKIVTGEGTDTEVSDPRFFRTAGADSWKAAVIGDFHHYSPLWRRLDASMAMLEVLDSVSGGFDWVLSPGDQCAWGGSYNYWTELSEQPSYINYMWGAVQGNHDNMSRDKELTDAYFRDTHAHPHNGYVGQEGVVYWFKYGDVLFLMLNNEAMRTAESLAPVFEWMENVVAANPARYIVVVEHYEWLIGTDGSDSQLDRFRDVFDRLGVDLAISGNNHAYLRTRALRDRKPVAAGRGTFYVVASSSDDSRGRELKPLAANEEIISTRWSEGAKTVGAMLMDVNPHRIVMTLYDREGRVCDAFTVPARR
ncbi:MAG: metallophosphoesterase [Muribaculaceae bacterium]|nr:metallophosphoesterase [Muribaculaceae bacterium]